MTPRKKDVMRLPRRREQASAIPRPLLELYNRASLFLDKSSTHQDHYWAVGIHKAIHASFPDCGETHTATTQNPGRSCCQVSPHCHRNAGAVSENQAPINQRKQPHNPDTSGQMKNEDIAQVSRDIFQGGQQMINDKSVQFARWWVALADVKTKIDNEIVPVGTHLGVEDHDLMDALEALSQRIESHLEGYKLQAVPIDG